MNYQPERLYHRVRDIHERFGGQRQGGISTPPAAPYIFLFTGEVGEQHGYSDGFEESGTFVYTGEGQRGDMEFVRGNKAIRDHAANGKTLLLFESSRKSGYYRFKGEFAVADFDDSQFGPDTESRERRLIRFRLIPTSAIADEIGNQDSEAVREDEKAPISVLRERAFAALSPEKGSAPSQAMRTVYRRSEAVKAYVLARAQGLCECCSSPAPFIKKNGQPYLEPHHIRQLSDEGLDSPTWVAAICPSCHREIHHGMNGLDKNRALQERIASIEKA